MSDYKLTLDSMRVLLRVIVPVALGALSSRAYAQAAALNWWQEDSARIAFLKTHGQSYSGPSIVVWALRDSLDHQWLPHFSDSLARSVDSLRALIGSHPWQRIANRPVNFYLSPGRFISHTDGRDNVFLSLSILRQRRAPFLHEAAHELLDPGAPFYPMDYPDSVAAQKADAQFPHWLTEGLPDYLAQVVAAKTGFPEGDVFGIGGLTKVDSVCAARLGASKRRDEILARVGGSGRLAALLTTERPEVAPVFYACSQSFTKYVIDKMGLPAVVGLFPQIKGGAWQAAIKRGTGMTLEHLRESWLATVAKAGPR